MGTVTTCIKRNEHGLGYRQLNMSNLLCARLDQHYSASETFHLPHVGPNSDSYTFMTRNIDMRYRSCPINEVVNPRDAEKTPEHLTVDVAKAQI